jgi:predicted metalloendopeptidase
LQTVNGTIGEALGKLYVEKDVSCSQKEKAEKMIHNIIYLSKSQSNLDVSQKQKC